MGRIFPRVILSELRMEQYGVDDHGEGPPTLENGFPRLSWLKNTIAAIGTMDHVDTSILNRYLINQNFSWNRIELDLMMSVHGSLIDSLDG